jgi:hypothetical protein
MSPTNSMGHLDLGIVYADAGRKEDALGEFKTAMQAETWRCECTLAARPALSLHGKDGRSKAEFEKSKSLNKTADERLLKVMSRVPQQEQRAPGRGCRISGPVTASPIELHIEEIST